MMSSEKYLIFFIIFQINLSFYSIFSLKKSSKSDSNIKSSQNDNSNQLVYNFPNFPFYSNYQNYPNLANYPQFAPSNFFQGQMGIMANPTNNQTTQNKTEIAEKRLKELKKSIKPENLAEFRCSPSDIYCLCKFHPKYKNCVCLAYPKSVVCSSTYCFENKNSYECNPMMCEKTDKKNTTDCFCRENINHIRCKCKLNPLDKDCFCLKFPLSHLCNQRMCKYNPNSLYCKCEINPKDQICSPKYCHKNPKSPLCKCLLNPLDNKCKCINDPNNCSKEEIMKSIVDYDSKIRKMCSNKKNKNEKPIDPKALYNTYYPPCIYGKENKKKAINSPCLPIPHIDGVTRPLRNKHSNPDCKKDKKDKKRKEKSLGGKGKNLKLKTKGINNNKRNCGKDKIRNMIFLQK